jgi:hypothetical protein
MPDSGGLKPLWQRLFEEASVETDREKLKDLINRLEEALMIRGEEIGKSPNYIDERTAMAKASESLLVMMTEKLNWPPIEKK